ncbi:unknown [Tropheryma whipplei str. Twist]|uniref:Uncharacterized protein n=2 Tax=Tropheryma whipplei TaxID=2039 RepID=Q83FH5_TROWT|nr:unknown [Tropheryma whipplei str. Twist]CAD67432.1 putative membrane protein [Tropheryma whipplei TW08/27]
MHVMTGKAMPIQQQVGVVLVVAMLVIPGVSASLLSRKISRMFIISPVMAVTTSVAGVYISYTFDLPPGSVIVLVMGSVFVLTYTVTSIMSMIVSNRTLLRTRHG